MDWGTFLLGFCSGFIIAWAICFLVFISVLKDEIKTKEGTIDERVQKKASRLIC